MKLVKVRGIKGPRSIRTKLILSFAALILAATMAVGIFSILNATNSLTSEAQKTLITMAEEGAKYTNSRIAAQLGTLEIIAVNDSIISMDWEDQQPVLQRMVGETDFLDIAVVSPDGVARYSGGDTSELGDREYVKKAFAGEANVSDLIVSRVTNSVVLMYAVPIIKDGKVTGALIGRMDGNALSEITDDIAYGVSGYSYMINNAGIIVAHPEKDKVMNQFNPIIEAKNDKSMSSLAELFIKVLEEKTGDGGYTYNGQKKLAGYAPVEASNWYFVIAAHQGEVLAAIPKLSTSIIIITAIIVVISAALVYFFGYSLAKPIIKVVGLAKHISGLYLKENVPQIYLKKKDEIGDLARALQEITDSLRGIIKEISDSSEQVATASKELTTTSQQLAVSAEEVALTVGEIANGASDQARDLEKGFDTATVLGHTIEKDQVYIKGVTVASKKVMDAVDEGLELIEDLSRITEDNNDASKEVHEVIQLTHSSSNKIGEASMVISSIAKQTNLLALNASIEAARAGESGKGFAVVAEEIRKLAEMSTASTNEIDEVVSELKGNSQNAMDTIRKVTAISDKQTQSVKNTKEKYMLITKAMKEAEQAVYQLNASGEEMERMKIEILGTLENLSAIAEENSASTEEMSASIEEQSASVEEMASASEGLADMAQQLRAIIERFQV